MPERLHQLNTPSSATDDTLESEPKQHVETKDIVTPYAFGVSDLLLGTRLATPFQRGVAQGIDLFLVVVLSSLNAFFLAVIATATFYKASNNLAHNPKRATTRALLRVGGAIMLLWTVLLALDFAFEEPAYQVDNEYSSYDDNTADSMEIQNEESIVESTPSATSTYSIIEWVKGFISDLGLGFGWAALYYSVFTAWFNGKTPGKRIINIRVLKLDGSGLSLWESFGRYGGYGAGLATGLLGFMQIYWDPNRQAIQDKISETLVISASK